MTSAPKAFPRSLACVAASLSAPSSEAAARHALRKGAMVSILQQARALELRERPKNEPKKEPQKEAEVVDFIPREAREPVISWQRLSLKALRAVDVARREVVLKDVVGSGSRRSPSRRRRPRNTQSARRISCRSSDSETVVFGRRTHSPWSSAGTRGCSPRRQDVMAHVSVVPRARAAQERTVYSGCERRSHLQ